MNWNAFAGVLVAAAVLNGCAAPAETGTAPTPSPAPAAAESMAPAPAGTPATAAQTDAARAVFTAINNQRRSAGCNPLAWDEVAARVAQAHSEDMAKRGALVHQSAEGREPWDRLRGQRVRFSEAAENITRTTTGAGSQGAVTQWLASTGHRENIENCRFTRTGVGVSGEYWTQVFYTPQRSRSQ